MTTTRSVAPRTLKLAPEGIIKIGQRVRALLHEGKDVVHLGIGDPGFDSPPEAVAALIESIQRGNTHYTDSKGTLELRTAVSDYFNRTRPGCNAVPQHVLVGPGAKPLIFSTMMALLSQGDEVIIPSPGFPSFAACGEYAGATCVLCPLREERGFRMDPDDVGRLITPRTKMLVLNSPHNPTGAVLTKDDIHRFAALAVANNLFVLSDEIYSQTVFDGCEHHSICTRPGMRDRTILIDGTIKQLAMTGWRVGFALFPPHLIDALDALHGNLWSCMPQFTQDGATAALRSGQAHIDRIHKAYTWRRQHVVAAVQQMRLVKNVTIPGGAFYIVFSLVPALHKRTEWLCSELLERFLVCVTPGTCFGPYGEGIVRISYCCGAEARLQEGLQRLAKGLAQIERELLNPKARL